MPTLASSEEDKLAMERYKDLNITLDDNDAELVAKLMQMAK